MKKKIVSIILVFGMMLGLAGCNAITIDGEGETVENAGMVRSDFRCRL